MPVRFEAGTVIEMPLKGPKVVGRPRNYGVLCPLGHHLVVDNADSPEQAITLQTSFCHRFCKRKHAAVFNVRACAIDEVFKRYKYVPNESITPNIAREIVQYGKYK